MVDATSTQSVSGSGSPVIVKEENWYRDVEIVDSARTLELSDEEAERLMPEPTAKTPWFGYESFADYGDEGLDAVADNDGDSKKSGGRAPAAKASSASDGSERATEGKSRVGGATSAAAPDPSGDGSTTDVTKAPGCNGPDKVTAGVEVDTKIVKFKVEATWDTENDGGDPHSHNEYK